ncbi:MAG: hypothetical protein J07HN4v3_02918 [Halonotius sp. J07HN4]|nr:MAG: hypothetical protein J07HN4v3_02918 [Halonotius sp. J07HN4]
MNLRPLRSSSVNSFVGSESSSACNRSCWIDVIPCSSTAATGAVVFDPPVGWLSAAVSDCSVVFVHPAIPAMAALPRPASIVRRVCGCVGVDHMRSYSHYSPPAVCIGLPTFCQSPPILRPKFGPTGSQNESLVAALLRVIDDVLIVPGVKISTGDGHPLGLGVSEHSCWSVTRGDSRVSSRP